jgi:hypothetical protein
MYSVRVLKLKNVLNSSHKIQQLEQYGYYSVDILLINLLAPEFDI